MSGTIPSIIAAGAFFVAQTASPLQVDRGDYTAACIKGSGDPCRYGFTLVARYENETRDTLYIDRCYPTNRGPMYGVEVVDDTAEAAYDYVWACVGGVSPIVIPPHTTRVDTLRIEGPNTFDGKTHAPTGKLEGEFRLLYDMSSCLTGRTKCQLSPTRQRSGPFRVHLAH